MGVWETVDPSQLGDSKGIEKVTIDFRESGEFTLLIHQEGSEPQNGKYALKGEELTMVQDDMEAGSIATAYKDGILTVIDVANNDHSVDFKRVE